MNQENKDNKAQGQQQPQHYQQMTPQQQQQMYGAQAGYATVPQAYVGQYFMAPNGSYYVSTANPYAYYPQMAQQYLMPQQYTAYQQAGMAQYQQQMAAPPPSGGEKAEGADDEQLKQQPQQYVAGYQGFTAATTGQQSKPKTVIQNNKKKVLDIFDKNTNEKIEIKRVDAKKDAPAVPEAIEKPAPVPVALPRHKEKSAAALEMQEKVRALMLSKIKAEEKKKEVEVKAPEPVFKEESQRAPEAVKVINNFREAVAKKVKDEEGEKKAEKPKSALQSVVSESISTTVGKSSDVEEETKVSESVPQNSDKVAVEGEETLELRIPMPTRDSKSNKMVLSVDFLLQFKNLPRAKVMPESLEKVNLHTVSVAQKSGKHRPPTAFGAKERFNDRSNVSNSRDRNRFQSNRGNASKGPVFSRAELNSFAPLVVGENAWKPQEAKDDHEMVIKETKMILNKLSRERFDAVCHSFLDLQSKMPDLKTLQEVVRMIQDKALSEPKFSDMYADLCRVVYDDFRGSKNDEKKNRHLVYKRFKFIRIESVENDGETLWYWTRSGIITADNKEDLIGPFDSEYKACAAASKAVDFKRILLTFSQKEFEAENKFEEMKTEKEELQKKLDNETVAKEKESLLEKIHDINSKHRSMKQRTFGNMIFIGELFKKDLISIKVMTGCLESLLGNKKELENGEDADIHVPEMEEIECLCKLFSTVGKLLESKIQKSNGKMDSYHDVVPFVLQRLTIFSKSKKLDARHRFMCQDVLDLKKNNWKETREVLKAKTIKEIHEDSKREEEEKARELQRQQQAKRSNYRGSGGYGGGNNYGGNRNNYNDRRYGQSNEQRQFNVATSKATGYIQKSGGVKIQKGGAAFAPLKQVSAKPAMGTKLPATTKNAWGTTNASVAPKTSSSRPSAAKSVDRKALKKTAKGTLKEYQSLKDAVEVKENFKIMSEKLADAQTAALVYIEVVLDSVMEGSPENVDSVIAFSKIFFESKLVSSTQFVEKASEIFEFLSDVAIDAPRAPDMVARFLALLLSSKSLSRSDVKESLESAGEIKTKVAEKIIEQAQKLGVDVGSDAQQFL